MCQMAAKDGNVRVVVLASALEKMFTAGLDVSLISVQSWAGSFPADSFLLPPAH